MVHYGLYDAHPVAYCVTDFATAEPPKRQAGDPKESSPPQGHSSRTREGRSPIRKKVSAVPSAASSGVKGKTMRRFDRTRAAATPSHPEVVLSGLAPRCNRRGPETHPLLTEPPVPPSSQIRVASINLNRHSTSTRSSYVDDPLISESSPTTLVPPFHPFPSTCQLGWFQKVVRDPCLDSHRGGLRQLCERYWRHERDQHVGALSRKGEREGKGAREGWCL